MLVYIPTMGRVGKQPTADALRGSAYEPTLVCPSGELKAHWANGYDAIACNAQGIGPTRQWILDSHGPGDNPHICLVDDDLRFAVRRLDEPSKFVPTEDVNTIFDRIDKMLLQAPIVGLQTRGGANHTSPPVAPRGRIHDLMGLDLNVVRKHRIRLNTVPFMEDFAAVLQALSLGYPTPILTTHTKDDIGGSNASGGCSTYRDSAGQAAAARTLAARYPDFVTLVERKGWAGDMSGTRLDVRVAWAKAFEAGCKNREMLGLAQHPEPDWTGLAPEWDGWEDVL